jgi:hypothetical protein
MTEHRCPYDGRQLVHDIRGGTAGVYADTCGDNGWLCDRCKQDRADNRALAIARAICTNDMSRVMDDLGMKE